MSQPSIDLQAYVNTHQLLRDAIEGLDYEQLHWKSAPDKWSVTEVLSHVTDHNLVVSFRIREILANSTAVLPGFSQDQWVSGTAANESAPEDILAVFQALLTYNSLLLGRLSADSLERTGVNFKGETVTLPVIVEAFIGHVHRHIGQIDRIKASYSKV